MGNRTPLGKVVQDLQLSSAQFLVLGAVLALNGEVSEVTTLHSEFLKQRLGHWHQDF